ncbi:MAG: sensor histidine kinase [Anaerolineae bacterium]
MKHPLSFRSMIMLLFVAGMMPVLISVGLVVYRLQQGYLLRESEQRLVRTVESEVAQYTGDSDLTVLAVSLGESLRVLGADLFVQDPGGAPVPPAFGTGPWLSPEAHRAVRDASTSRLEMIETDGATRLVYLAAVTDGSGTVLGSVEASLSLEMVTRELDALRRWLILIITTAIALSVLVAVPLSATITRPLKGLLTAVERVRQGDLETRAPVPEIEELGQLAATYNTMLDRIADDLHAQARQAESMRRFAADASHELRSPLTVFRNSVDLLEQAMGQDNPEQFAGILAMQRQEVDTMTRLVESLLLLARLDQPEATVVSNLHPEEVHPLPLLEEIYERSLLLARGQEVELVWPKVEIPPICADRELVREALNNLVENAIAHTSAGKKITLRLEIQDDYSCFVVEDEGSGIARDQLPRIFERFYRGDASRDRRTRGTGLGLAIVAAIVRAHNGEVEVESELGEGTRFRLSFRQLTLKT